jgi:CheY-like chemotaxis protein
MGLVGNLEDLGLGDILQIVSLARKSGVLNLSSGEVKGKIIFRDGLVVSALSSEIKRNFGLMLLEASVINQPQLEELVAESKQTGELGLLIRDFAVQKFGITREKFLNVITKEVEDVVYSFFTWPEGNFSFELMEIDEEIKQLKNPWRQFVLDQGLSPQYLAMEGTRLQDERRRMDAEPAVGPLPGEKEFEIKDEEFKREPGAGEQDFSSVSDFLDHYEKTQKGEQHKEAAPKPAAAPPASLEPAPERVVEEPSRKPAAAESVEKVAAKAPAPVPGSRLVLAIDDEPLLLEAMDRHFSQLGYQVEIFSSVSPAVARVKELHKKGIWPIVVADLIMPSSVDQNLLGGLEILQQVKKVDARIPCILNTDYENQPAQKQAEGLLVNFFFFKPKSSQIDENFSNPELVNFLQVLESAINSLEKTLPQIPVPVKEVGRGDELFDLVDELKRELGDEDFTVPDFSEEKKSRGLGMLRNMIAELNDPSSNGQITLMVLRFASELMNRAVIFVITKDQVAGLGQFGIQLNGKDPEKQVRRMRIPLDEPSIFQEVMQKRIPLKKKLKANKWNQYLVDRLGGMEPKEVFVAPIITSGKVAAIIYGDNAPEEIEIGDTESLEIFLVQVGMAMEKALLERRIKEMRREEAAREGYA